MRTHGCIISTRNHHEKPQYCVNECRASSDTEECGVSQTVELGEKCILMAYKGNVFLFLSL